MSQRTRGLRRPLSNARIYSLVQRALGAERVRRAFVHEHLRPVAGESILDLGCGPGDILELLPAVAYLGVDNSMAYIESARSHFGERGHFICADVTELALGAEQGFDAAISMGVLHHLDDSAADAMMQVVADALKPEGRLITIDPARAEPQARAARWLISRDRGERVNTADGYRALAARHFSAVCAKVRHDLARVPYTHAILECRAPRRSSNL